MALGTYTLAEAADLKALANITNTASDSLIEALLDRASEEVEAYLQRNIITRGELTEYHSVEPSGAWCVDLFTTQFPIASITSVAEGFWTGDGTWAAAATLTKDAQFVVDLRLGKLTRIIGRAGLTRWAVGFEAVRIVYAAGVANRAAVPAGIKSVVLDIALRRFRRTMRADDGVQSATDGMGSVTRFLPSELLRTEKEKLSPWRAKDYGRRGRVA